MRIKPKVEEPACKFCVFYKAPEEGDGYYCVNRESPHFIEPMCGDEGCMWFVEEK